MSVHFDLPFTLAADGQFSVTEQDSEQDVEACILALLRARVGVREDRPDIGIDDPTFQQGGANLEALVAAITTFEPRAEPLLSRDPERLTGLIDRILVERPSATAEQQGVRHL